MSIETIHGPADGPVVPTSDAEGVHSAPHVGPGLIAALCIAWLTALALVALLAPVLPLDDPELADFTAPVHAPPSGDHLLGTDELGRDILSRLIWGARVSLIVSAGVVTIGGTIGTAVGVIAGYIKGVPGGILMAIMNVILAFPGLVLLITLTTLLGPGVRNVTIGISIISIPAFARVARATTLTFARREFVVAARATGATHRRLVWREILPNVLPSVGTFAMIVIGVAIVAEGGLAFLGLSVPNPQPSWGTMINNGRGDLARGYPHVSLIPACAMFLTVLAVNMLGDHLRARFEVKDVGI